MEVGAVHITEMKNPAKEFPKAIFSAMFIIIAIFTLGAMAIAVVMPAADIDLNVGIMQGFSKFLNKFGISWLLPVIGLLVAFGAVGAVFGWMTGPSKGLLATAKDGDLPPFMAKTNKNGVPKNILKIQGIIVTFIAFVFVIMPNVSSAFFILSILTVSPYLVMYLLLYASAIRLRYTQANVPRAFKLPGGKFGIWFVCGIGTLAVLFAFIIGFFPPSQLTVGSPTFYTWFLIIGVVVFVLLPIIIGFLKKPEWKQDSDKK